MADVDSWQEKVLIAVTQIGASDINFAANLEELSAMGMGNRPVEFQSLLNSGYLDKFSPEEKAEVRFKGRFVGAGGDESTEASVNKLFFANVSYTAGGYYMIDSSFPSTLPSRKKYRVAVLWTTETAASDACGAVGSTYEGERYVFSNGYMTVNDLSFSDKDFTCELAFEFAPRAKDNTANYLICDNVGCEAELPAISAYTTSANW